MGPDFPMAMDESLPLALGGGGIMGGAGHTGCRAVAGTVEGTTGLTWWTEPLEATVPRSGRETEAWRLSPPTRGSRQQAWGRDPGQGWPARVQNLAKVKTRPASVLGPTWLSAVRTHKGGCALPLARRPAGWGGGEIRPSPPSGPISKREKSPQSTPQGKVGCVPAS